MTAAASLLLKSSVAVMAYITLCQTMEGEWIHQDTGLSPKSRLAFKTHPFHWCSRGKPSESVLLPSNWWESLCPSWSGQQLPPHTYTL